MKTNHFHFLLIFFALSFTNIENLYSQCGGFDDSPSSVCRGATMTFTSSYTSGATWSVDPAYLQIISSSSSSVTVSGIAEGTGNLCLTYNVNGVACSVCKPIAVLPAPTLSGPTNAAICAGLSTQFTVSAGGSNLTYQWQVNGNNITDGGYYSGATTPTLTITNAPSSFNGYTYRVIVSNGICGSISAAATLTVYPLPTPSVSNYVYDPNHNFVKINGQPTTNYGLAYTWYIDGQVVSGPINGNSSYAFTANCQQIYQVQLKERNNTTGCEATSSCVKFNLECGSDFWDDMVDNDWSNNYTVNRGSCGGGGGGESRVASEKVIKIYPNPSSSRIQLEITTEGSKKISVINNFGKVVLEKETSQNNIEIDISHLPKGQYFIKTLSGKTKSIERFIIDR